MDKGGIVKTINGLLMKDTRTDEMDKGGIVKTVSGLLVEDTRADDEAGHEWLCLELSVGLVRIEWVAKLTGLQPVGNWNNQQLHRMAFAEWDTAFMASPGMPWCLFLINNDNYSLG